MASGIYTSLKTNLMKAVIDLASDTINTALLNSSSSFNATNTVWSNISSNEISGTGYTTGGQALSGQAVSASGTAAVWTANNVSWSAATFSAAFCALYDVSVSNDLICFFDFGGTISVSAGTFEIEWASSPLTGSIISFT